MGGAWGAVTVGVVVGSLTCVPLVSVPVAVTCWLCMKVKGSEGEPMTATKARKQEPTQMGPAKQVEMHPHYRWCLAQGQ